MDIKPHNVLMRRPQQRQPASSSTAAPPGHQNMSADAEEDEQTDVEAGVNLVRHCS